MCGKELKLFKQTSKTRTFLSELYSDRSGKPGAAVLNDVCEAFYFSSLIHTLFPCSFNVAVGRAKLILMAWISDLIKGKYHNLLSEDFLLRVKHHDRLLGPDV